MKKILVGLDASPRAPVVLAAAVTLAQASGAKLSLFRAVGIPVELPKEALNLSPDKTEELLESHAKTGLQELAKGAPAGLVEDVKVHAGVAWQAICNAAREAKADVIVIGSHGYHGLDRLLGTTAAKVVNHAECSVYVVRG